MFPVRKRRQPEHVEQEFTPLILTDFTGGINVTDPAASLAENEFSMLYNFQYTRKGLLETRPPYRPYSFSSVGQDSKIQVTIGTDVYNPVDLIGAKAFKASITDWSYNGELHAVWGEFESGTAGDRMIVAVWKSSTDSWQPIWYTDTGTTYSHLSVCPYEINEAFDLIIFPQTSNPERWVPGTETGGLTDLGLTKPAVDAFAVGFTEADNTDGMDVTAGETINYKYAYFYDDSNSSTKYGESASTSLTSGSSHSFTSTGKVHLTLDFTDVSIPADVTKIKIYRAPLGTSDGPYRLVGETSLSGTDGAGAGTISSFTDTTAWGFEGEEDLQEGSNPSASGATLVLQNVERVGPYLIGFDASMDYKLVWCQSGYPDIWHPLNYDYLEGEGQKAIFFNRSMYVFTTKGVWQKSSMSENASKICNIGCIDGRTLTDVGSGLMWADYDSVYFADFVTQYGSKGDFPRNVGRRISDVVRNRLATSIVYAEFFERRYYITFVDKSGYTRKCFVYDVDIDAWTQHSMGHAIIYRGARTLYSIGFGTTSATSTSAYVFEHDYSAIITDEETAGYSGRDYRDYNAYSSGYIEAENINTYLEKPTIQPAGEYRKVFISSVSVMVEGTEIDATITLTGGNDDFSASISITKELGNTASDEYIAYYDSDGSVYAAVSASEDATLAEKGYAGFTTGYLNKHKKVKRVVKSREITFAYSSQDSRDIQILGLGMYIKPLPLVA